jgi:CheY-like chemotaxis protein
MNMNTEALVDGGEPPAHDLTGIRVLIVEDDDDSRAMMAEVLTGCHATVSVAGSGEEALRVVARGNLDVLVSDIGLPDMDGYALIQRIRAAMNEWVPAIALTGHDSASEARRGVSGPRRQACGRLDARPRRRQRRGHDSAPAGGVIRLTVATVARATSAVRASVCRVGRRAQPTIRTN